MTFTEYFDEVEGRPDYRVKATVGEWVVTYVLEFPANAAPHVERVAISPRNRARVPEGGVTTEVLAAVKPALAVELASATVLHPRRVYEEGQEAKLRESGDWQRWEASQAGRPGAPRVQTERLLLALDCYRAVCASGKKAPLTVASRQLRIKRDLLRSYVARARAWGLVQPARHRGSREISFTPKGAALLADYRKPARRRKA